MRICILTFHRAQNYGAVLQAYALQKKIEELGYTCDILDYRCEKIENSYKLFGVKSPSPKNVVSMLLHLPFNIKKEKSFAKFRKQFLRISEEIYTRQNIANSNKEYDVFIVGSDQVWNGDLTGVDRTYFLDFVKERKTKIAYAASVKIKITATNKVYQFDECFSSGLNIIASDDNTRGKSSVLIAIYYCLGFEEIIGGLNEKVLTSAYKNQIEDKDTSWPVLESGAYLEISNGTDEITIYRSAKHETRDSKLVTVYFSKLDYIYNVDTTSEDYYVHMKFAATNRSGFHTFLEKFLQIELPLVLYCLKRYQK